MKLLSEGSLDGAHEVARRLSAVWGYAPEPRVTPKATWHAPEGVELEVIADELGVSRQAAGQLIERTLRKCRRYLARHYPELSLEDLLPG